MYLLSQLALDTYSVNYSEMEKERKKLRDTKLGLWLRDKAPDVLDAVGDMLPDQGALGIVKNLLDKGEPLSHEETMELRHLELELQIEEQKAVTDRWKADMASDVKVAKYIRPVMLIMLFTLYAVFAIADSVEGWGFEVKESYIDLLQVLMLTAFGAYFAGRSIEKTRK